VLLNGEGQIEETTPQLEENEKLNFRAKEHASLLTVAFPPGFLVSAVLQRASVIHLFLEMARKVDEAANFVFVQLTEESGISGKCHADYAKQDKIYLAWERIPRETKESGSRLRSFRTI
jgi:hypothetical protein